MRVRYGHVQVMGLENRQPRKGFASSNLDRVEPPEDARGQADLCLGPRNRPLRLLAVIRKAAKSRGER